MEFQAVLEAVRSLPVDDQVRLVDLIQDDLLGQDDELQLPPEQIKEIEKRIQAYDADPSIGIPWQDFESHMDQRLKELGE